VRTVKTMKDNLFMNLIGTLQQSSMFFMLFSSKNTSKIMKNNFAKANFGMNDSRATNEAVNQSNPVTNASMIIS
jgi:hypothetical protein